MKSFHSLTKEELLLAFQEKNEPSYRVDQVLQWIFEKKEKNFQKFTNLSKTLREWLQEEFCLSTLQCEKIDISEDQETVKFLFKLSDGHFIESVLIFSLDRRTVCLSTQVGCPGHCAFCASGQAGFIRNLSLEEIVEQAFIVAHWLLEREERLSHIVFMGMGEPFENFITVRKAIDIFNDMERFAISQRRMTISTVGIIENIKKFADENLSVGLALSLHASNQKLREKLIPYAKKNPLPELLEAMLYFAKTTGRDLTYEYALIEDVNDSPTHAKELVELIKDHPATVNLIPYNPVEKVLFKRPSKEAIEIFKTILEKAHIPTTLRYTKGSKIAAACGQLAFHKNVSS